MSQKANSYFARVQLVAPARHIASRITQSFQITLTKAITMSVALAVIAGCSLATKPIPASVQTIHMRVETLGKICETAWTKAHRYLLGEGIDVVYNDKATRVLICADVGFHLHGFGIARSDGVAVVIASSISSTQTAKIIAHEALHLFGRKHEWTGIMNPISELAWFGG